MATPTPEDNQKKPETIPVTTPTQSEALPPVPRKNLTVRQENLVNYLLDQTSRIPF